MTALRSVSGGRDDDGSNDIPSVYFSRAAIYFLEEKSMFPAALHDSSWERRDDMFQAKDQAVFCFKLELSDYSMITNPQILTADVGMILSMRIAIYTNKSMIDWESYMV